MKSDPAFGSIYFRQPTNIVTGEEHANMYAGEPVDATFIASVNPNRQLPLLPQGFDPAVYLALNPDVAAAGVRAEDHYKKHGRLEGRPYR